MCTLHCKIFDDSRFIGLLLIRLNNRACNISEIINDSIYKLSDDTNTEYEFTADSLYNSPIFITKVGDALKSISRDKDSVYSSYLENPLNSSVNLLCAIINSFGIESDLRNFHKNVSNETELTFNYLFDRLISYCTGEWNGTK